MSQAVPGSSNAGARILSSPSQIEVRAHDLDFFKEQFQSLHDQLQICLWSAVAIGEASAEMVTSTLKAESDKLQMSVKSVFTSLDLPQVDISRESTPIEQNGDAARALNTPFGTLSDDQIAKIKEVAEKVIVWLAKYIIAQNEKKEEPESGDSAPASTSSTKAEEKSPPAKSKKKRGFKLGLPRFLTGKKSIPEGGQLLTVDEPAPRKSFEVPQNLSVEEAKKLGSHLLKVVASLHNHGKEEKQGPEWGDKTNWIEYFGKIHEEMKPMDPQSSSSSAEAPTTTAAE